MKKEKQIKGREPEVKVHKPYIMDIVDSLGIKLKDHEGIINVEYNQVTDNLIIMVGDEIEEFN